ncbi:uncharacterized protein LOC131604359 [Vicia villosa]|uniref:uncharacterized protein LOC131604359 n=1 Tax=Vicia villosa TaxID=3911 RepID=UPI00273B0FE4|nr:uncharacterized protein LOC131604359 [Vicia villosa]
MIEYLNRLMGRMQTKPDFHHHAKCEKLNLTNLTFAYDVLLFCRGDERSVKMMLSTINQFSASTGLVVNSKKCKVYCGGLSDEDKHLIQAVTKFEEWQLPMRYLGIPITSKKLNIHHYMPLIEKILQRMTHWTSKMLSYAGRIQLVKSISMAITQYWMHCLPLPQFVIRKIDTMCKTFIWAGSTEASRKSPIAWNTMCKPRDQGGLGYSEPVNLE